MPPEVPITPMEWKLVEQAHKAILSQMLGNFHTISLGQTGIASLMKEIEQIVVDACSQNPPHVWMHIRPNVCRTVEREIERPCAVLKAMVMQSIGACGSIYHPYFNGPVFQYMLPPPQRINWSGSE